MKDDPNAGDWYCAEIRKILADRIEVNYYTTATPALVNYQESTVNERSRSIKSATFLRTWCLDRGTHDYANNYGSWEIELSMVGKNPNGGCGQTHIDKSNRIKCLGKIRQNHN